MDLTRTVRLGLLYVGKTLAEKNLSRANHAVRQRMEVAANGKASVPSGVHSAQKALRDARDRLRRFRDDGEEWDTLWAETQRTPRQEPWVPFSERDF